MINHNLFPNQKFALGQIVATTHTADLLDTATMHELLSRHAAGDWGDVCKEDAELNDESINDGNRLLSSYKVNDRTTIWIITEASRECTTFLLPSEY